MAAERFLGSTGAGLPEARLHRSLAEIPQQRSDEEVALQLAARARFIWREAAHTSTPAWSRPTFDRDFGVWRDTRKFALLSLPLGIGQNGRMLVCLVSNRFWVTQRGGASPSFSGPHPLPPDLKFSGRALDVRAISRLENLVGREVTQL